MANAERGFWIEFPKCEKSTDLQAHLAQWISLKQKYGNHLPEDHLIHMLHGILPDEVREAIKMQRDIKYNLQRQLDFIYSEIGTFMDSKLSKWNLSKLQQSLKPRIKNSTGINFMQASDTSPTPVDVPPPPVPDMNAFQANVERMINAAFSRGRDTQRTPPASRSGSSGSGRNGRTSRNLPSPKFDGCWCCGSKDHTRQKCPVFADIRKKNGGKVPKDYVGAYEKSLQGKPTSVKAISIRSSSPCDAEFAETLKLWPMLASPPKPPEVHNRFSIFQSREALDDLDESEDDEDEVIKALSQISAKVTKGRTSQKSKKSGGKKILDTAYLNSVAQKIKDGVITLPEIELDGEESYHYVWALVDSGAGANVARRNQFPHSEAVAAPPIALTVANGDTLPNRGARKVTFKNPDGTKRTRIFYEADVDMPILSVGELSREGTNGSEVRFRKRDGYIEDLWSGQQMPFVKRQGVYFVKLCLPKNKTHAVEDDASFHRQAR